MSPSALKDGWAAERQLAVEFSAMGDGSHKLLALAKELVANTDLRELAPAASEEQAEGKSIGGAALLVGVRRGA